MTVRIRKYHKGEAHYFEQGWAGRQRSMPCPKRGAFRARRIPLDTILLALLKIGGVSDAKIVGWPHSSASHLWYLSEDEHELVGSAMFGESFCFIPSPRFSSGRWELGLQASAASDPGGVLFRTIA